MLTSDFSASNQNGAPNETAMAVKNQPKSRCNEANENKSARNAAQESLLQPTTLPSSLRSSSEMVLPSFCVTVGFKGSLLSLYSTVALGAGIVARTLACSTNALRVAGSVHSTRAM